jgi:hypothetical protein
VNLEGLGFKLDCRNFDFIKILTQINKISKVWQNQKILNFLPKWCRLAKQKIILIYAKMV